jgi:hypothetical protein
MIDDKTGYMLMVLILGVVILAALILPWPMLL